MKKSCITSGLVKGMDTLSGELIMSKLLCFVAAVSPLSILNHSAVFISILPGIIVQILIFRKIE